MVDKAKMVFDMVDRNRRSLIQTQKETKDPTVHMYYEGQIVACREIQAFAEKLAEIGVPSEG